MQDFLCDDGESGDMATPYVLLTESILLHMMRATDHVRKLRSAHGAAPHRPAFTSGAVTLRFNFAGVEH